MDADLDEVIGRSRFGPLHVRIVLLAGLVILFDGYDLTIYGAAVPRMIVEFGISPATAGLIGSGALVGMMIGAMAFGALADKVGRRRPIIACVVLYTVFTGAVFLAATPWEVGVYRFLAGLGLGGVMPNAVALVTEYAPTRLRSTMVSVMFSGYMVGGIAAALLGVALIPAYGWRSLFLLGALPLLAVPLLVKYLPEAPAFLLRRGRADELAATLRALDPGLPPHGDLRVTAGAEPAGRSPVASLFRNGNGVNTAMLWIAFFMVLLMIYGLLTWLPQLMIEAGYPLGSSLSFLMTLFLAGIVITWVGGYLSDRYGTRPVLIVSYLVAAVFVAALGFLGDSSLLWVYASVALGGGATFAAQIFANAYAAQFYPSSARSAGIGWALGIGRIGAIIGPLLGGVLLSAGVPLHVNFLAFAVPGIIAAAALGLIRNRTAAPRTAGTRPSIGA
ncbi:MFS transporter [Pseudonocardia broussonetiae]|uniref:Aromatic acid/H+ symport family MFS transporter n=1 Tax=Pseudonocardia broussonetiae TaxID=2736640 RepID=A0A6M6JIY5_9PSEU|nr:aromatic acid/H+ symport family MFS transporter [Pseudonocardia broussonetiae]QJY48008.1 aromatic acid/H+ symport family MFS transporter [Pseudonocardia broussonetiae]